MLKVRLFIFFGAIFMLTTVTLSSLSFVPPCDPRLNQVSEEIPPGEITTEKVQKLIQEMLILSGYEADPQKIDYSGILVGLAAPQIGVMQQIVIISTLTSAEIRAKKSPQFDVLINPKIIWQSEEKEVSREGCFSVPERFIGCPKRPTALVVEAYNPSGEKIRKRYEGSPAFVVHHEIDHLLGVRFPSRLDNEKELHILDQNKDIVRYRKEWKHWGNHAPFELWEQMKAGNYNQVSD